MMNQDQVACLQAIADANGGRLTPDAVIDNARNEESPLHGLFDWDEARAAMEHWRYRAREIIRAVRVNVVTDRTVVRTIAYVRDPSLDSRDQGYISTATLRDDVSLAREAVQHELMRAHSALQRAREVAEAVGLEREIDKLMNRVDRLNKKAQQGKAENRAPM
jgi:hypothetical protein